MRDVGYWLRSLGTGLALVLICAAEVAASAEDWMLLSRESGCVGLQMLANMERLPRAPSSPEAFAAMMRERGHSVTVGLPDGFPNDMTGQVVMVRYAENRAPIFLRAAWCARMKSP